MQRGPLLLSSENKSAPPAHWARPAAKALVAAARALAGIFVRWESSGEGSNCRCTSLASKAPIAAAHLRFMILIPILRFDLRLIVPHGLRSLWFSIASHRPQRVRNGDVQSIWA